MRLRAVVRLQHQNVDAGVFKLEITVFLGLTQPKLFVQVYYRSLRADCFESGDSSHWDGGALPKRSVAHLQRQRSDSARTGPVFARLKPEVMRCDNRRPRTQQR